MRVHVLLSGIPGTGKTTIARHLEAVHGFRHVDMEADGFRPKHDLKKDPDGFLTPLGHAERVVISWGFGPYMDAPLIRHIRDSGYTFVWLDGDHVAALASFLDREGHDPREEANYYGQMQMILATEIVERLAPVTVDPFSAGKFRPIGDIAAEILACAGG